MQSYTTKVSPDSVKLLLHILYQMDEPAPPLIRDPTKYEQSGRDVQNVLLYDANIFDFCTVEKTVLQLVWGKRRFYLGTWLHA